MAVFEAILCGVFVVLICRLIQLIIWRLRVEKLTKNVNCVKGLPLLGIALELIWSKNLLEYILKVTSSSLMKFWIGPFFLLFCVDDPQTMKQILNSDATLDKSEFYRFMRLDKCVFAEPKENWKVHRKALNTVRNRNRVIAFGPLILKKTERLVQSLRKKINAPEFEVFNYAGAFTIETTFEGFFDIEQNALDHPDSNELIHKIEKTNDVAIKRAITIPLHLEPIYRMTKLYQQEKKYNLDSYYEEIIKTKKQDWENCKPYTKNNTELLIAPILKVENGFTHEELLQNLKGFAFAGFDTSALALSSALLMLAIHQDVQQKVLEEIYLVLKSCENNLDYYTIKKMTFLDMVVKEVHRLFPSSPFLGRFASEDLKLENGVIIPAGTNILLTFYKTQRDPKYWGEDAHLFVPDRFEPDRFRKIHPYAYIPFSAGPRNCIAGAYGGFVLRMALVQILRNFKIFTSTKYEDIKVVTSITMKIAQGYKISLEERDFGS